MESSTDSNIWEYSEGEEVTGDNLAGEYFKVNTFFIDPSKFTKNYEKGRMLYYILYAHSTIKEQI